MDKELLRRAYNAGIASVEKNKEIDRLIDEGTKQCPERPSFENWYFMLSALDEVKQDNSYSIIEGFYIEDAWMSDHDYPEPPDEKEIPTFESENQWNAYRNALKSFSLKCLLSRLPEQKQQPFPVKEPVTDKAIQLLVDEFINEHKLFKQTLIKGQIDMHARLILIKLLRSLLHGEKAPEQKVSEASRIFDGCKECVNNKPGVENGLFCINNCVNGSMFKAFSKEGKEGKNG